MMATHYAPLLPPPQYMTLDSYRNEQKQLGTRRRVAIQRALNPTLNQFDHYDNFTDAALAEALTRLRLDNPAAALEALTTDCKVKGIPVPPQGVHAHKVGFKGPRTTAPAARQDVRPVVTLTRRIPR